MIRALILLSLTWSVVACASSGPAPDARPPHIVLFLVDDLGWSDTSVPMDGRANALHARAETPRLADFAARGVRFANAYACAVCSPTRTSLMTGQNAARHHVTQWTRKKDHDPSGVTERLTSPADWNINGLQPGTPTLPSLLRDAGYRTIHVGKAHWGATDTAGADPCALGFDVNIAGHSAGAPGSYSGLDNFGEHKPAWAVPGLEEWHGRDVHLSDVLTEAACRELRAGAETGQPLFLYFAHYAVHTPIQPHEPYASEFRARGLDAKEAAYASLMTGVDASFGRVLDQLRALGIAEDTLVLFVSDNGGLAVHSRGALPESVEPGRYNAPLRSGKGSAYEGGTRIPFVAGWAGDSAAGRARLSLEAGAIRQTPCLVEDWFATLLAWAGVELPPDHAVDGRDLTPVLTAGDSEGDPERALLFHYPHVWGPRGDGYEPHSALRIGAHKVIYFYQPRRWEVYDLARDPGERRDLSRSDPARLALMADRLIDALDRATAQFPTQRESGRPESPVR